MKINPIEILIIEDNLDDLFFIKKALKDDLYHYRIISSGIEAYEYLLNPPSEPDIVLIDYMLPGMNGLDILDNLKKEGKEYSYIFLTINNSITTVVEAMKRGALDFLVKSVSLKEELPGKIEKVYEIHKNRIEKKKNKEQLLKAISIAEENEMKYRTLVDAAFDAIIVTENGVIKEVNKRTLEMSGFSYNEVIGKGITFLLTQNSGEVENLLNQKGGKNVESMFERKDGDLLSVVINSKKAFLNEKEVMISSIKDVTESRMMEDKLRQSEKMSAIGQLAGGVAHDFNNQLSPIIGYADMLSNQLDNPQYKKYAQNILHSAIRSADLTKKLLSFARKGQIILEPVDFHKILKGILEIFERGINKNISIDRNFCFYNLIVHADFNQLEHAILNLLLNAKDAMPDGGILTVSTVCQYIDENEDLCVFNHLDPGDYIKLTIKDSGIGIPDGLKSKIFEPFFTTKDIGKGSGMGLASAFGAVKEHEGYISFKSEEGVGTIFNVYLPYDVKSFKQGIVRCENIPEKAEMSNILVVDDEEMLRQMLFDLLKKDNHKVTCCSNGFEAIKLFKEQGEIFDLVILDMIMPEMDGFETFVKMKEILPKVKVLISSGYNMNKDSQKLKDAGAMGFIHKPYKVNDLREQIKSILG